MKRTDEAQKERLNIVLRTLRDVNRLLAKERDRNRLITEICETLVENQGYYNVWILLSEGEGKIRAAAQSGLGDKFALLINRWKEHGPPECAIRALASAKVIITEHPRSACADCVLSADYGGRGAMTSRLEYSGKVYGLLCVSIPRNLLADQQERELIQEAARDIAFALSSIEAEEQKNQAERALLESENKLSTLMSNLPGMGYRCRSDDSRTMEYVSQGCRALTEFAPEDLINNQKTAFGRLIHAGDRERVLKQIREAVAKKKSFKIIYRLSTASGDVKWVWEQGVGVYQKDGALLRLEGFITDISDRMLAEEALQESEKRFRDLIENSLMGISMIQDGRVVYRNPEQQRLFGPLSESTNPFNMQNIHPDDKETVQRLYKDIVSGKIRSFQTEFRFFAPENSESGSSIQWVDCRANVITYKGKNAVLTNMLDMTRAKELEHFLLMQDKMSSLGHMAAGIAHEIRNPLSGINIYVNALEKICRSMEEAGKAVEITDQIKSASRKIESVIRRVMDFSKPGEPHVVLSDVNQPIREAVELASVTLRKSGIRLESVLGENLPACLLDTHMLEEVLLNLITNAADAMQGSEKEKRIEITTSSDDGFILIKVSDSGPGVPFFHRDKIFEPFYTTKRDSSGIGLSITHRIVRDHGGSIDVSASKWGGAEFRVRIPVRSDEVQDDQV